MKLMNKNIVILSVILQVMSSASLLLAKQESGAKLLTSEVIQKTQKLQIPFIANKGQIDERVVYYANTLGGTVFITKDGEIVYSLPKKSPELGVQSFELLEGIKDKKQDISGTNTLFIRNRTYLLPLITNLTRTWNLNFPFVKGELNNQASSLLVQSCTLDQNISVQSGRPSPYETLNNPHSANQNPQLTGLALKEEFVGGKINTIQGEAPSITKVNYFKGNDPSKWKTNISTYEVVDIGEIYKGINLKLRAYGSNVEKLFYVEPDADPDQIKVKLNGAKRLKINKEWQLEAKTELGTVKFTKPVSYQEIDGKRVEVAARYTLITSRTETLNSKLNPPDPELTYGFEVASYDKTKELIIDPLLASTFLGGSRGEWGYSLTVDDPSGNVYLTGFTCSSEFPTTFGVYDISRNRFDAFVSKLSNNLTSLIASTFLGGSSSDYGNLVAIDSNGDVCVAGDTFSFDFPTTMGVYDISYNGGIRIGDVFAAKLNSDLTTLIASTFVGGVADDKPFGMALDPSGNVYVSGYSQSPDFPSTVGAYDTSHNGAADVFVSMLSSDLSTLIASTFAGGSADEKPFRMVLDPSGNVYVSGYSQSSDFPTTAGAYDTSYNGGYDAFVSKLTSDLTNLVASTYLGGFSNDFGYSAGISSNGNIYLTGYTYSSSFPITSGAYDTSRNGAADVFVSRLSNDLSILIASTYLGGFGGENAYYCTIATNGDVYVTGHTISSNYPTTAFAYDTSNNGDYDVFVSKLSSDLTNLVASTYLGGLSKEFAYSAAIDSNGNVYVTGRTWSSDFPTTTDAYDTSYNGSYDAFVAKFNSNLSAPDTTPPTISSTDPASNAINVDINSVVTATFDEPMNPDTIINGNTFTVSGITGAVTYHPATITATFTPSSPLSYSAIYTATITTNAQDTTGNAMASNYSWSFTTSDDPTQ